MDQRLCKVIGRDASSFMVCAAAGLAASALELINALSAVI